MNEDKMKLEEAIKRCKIIITTKFNNDYSIDSIDKEAIETVLEEIMQKDLEIIGAEEYTKANMTEIIEQYYTPNEDCVHKNKIKDKIKEWKNINKIKSGATYNQDELIQILTYELQKLLEDK